MVDRESKSKVIFLVEDHADTRDVLRRVLTKLGYDVHPAAGVREARVLASAERPDILLCDIGLSDGDGCDLIAELKQQFPTLPAVALTGWANAADEERCRAAGFGWFLRKPADLHDVISIVEAAFKSGVSSESREQTR